MSGVLTAAATIAAAVGAAAAIRFIDRRRRDLGDVIRRVNDREDSQVIECERDPETGVYRPRR